MSDQAIFLIQNGHNVVLRPKAYEKEDLLQQLLAGYPDVLAGGSTDGDGTKSLLLVRREMGIPTMEGGGSTFSLDHLFLDQQGVPVIVEVKRSSDTRIRREVVGQMLDYAANATRYWPVAELRASLEKLQGDVGDPASAVDQVVQEFIGHDAVEDFWKAVETNLRSGRVRMVFVADQLPDELVRVIEFLNEQMNPAEVLGVEVPQYLGANGVQVLVPRLIGATKAAADTKRTGVGEHWTRGRFLEVAAERCQSDVVSLFARLFDHVVDHHGRLSWGKSVNPGVSAWYPINDEQRPVWTTSTGSGGRSAHPYLYLYFPELVGIENRFSNAFAALNEISSYRSGLAGAIEVGFKGKGAFPNMRLDEVASSKAEIDSMFAGIEALIDPPSESST